VTSLKLNLQADLEHAGLTAAMRIIGSLGFEQSTLKLFALAK
jgi:hypothetical protein